jgi:GT2 family glycosyltransferase
VTCDLSVSIVTYNSADSLGPLLGSIAAQHGVSFELFIVDNASTDGTASILSQCGKAHITRNARNVGYGRAHNQNRARFRGRYLLFLNPDVILPRDLFSEMVGFLDRNPAIAIAGPMILEGTERRPFPPRRFYPGEALLPLEPGLDRKEPAWITGCCLAIDRNAFESLGGFDPDYFLYFEDTELCWRARRAGLRIGWVPRCEVLHSGRGSQSGLSEYEQASMLFTGATIFWEKRYSARDAASMFRYQASAAQMLLLGSRLFPDSWWNGSLSRDRLRARRDVCRGWLTKRGRRLFPLDTRSWRIAARQLRLVAEWVRRGNLPVDDF